ncbi:flavin-containing monooxygenase [Arthrobacter bambusae]|uniref:flavin-containing monooxygenase n=1 Tax=Arthrobacter bambusae TaxID=1338426 RepID=UPI0027877763|nr:NAD(P)/FAD-dependent oxidoreductase [Arthrobacter bambusae]MDQ0029924.1 cation diffusion facilitator CzcD-associated flavoprotein CzcO [Arthrobacter bambusae]MDQ0097558.1 cation diffusion facilitator CzcD-associated flavoprotein CzcO [Arthrobacter bambusae]
MTSTNDHIYNALIIGAGFGGLGQGAQFVQEGIEDFVILERGNDVGGVWRENTYPGAACDTQALVYCYSYFLNLKVSRMFAGQEELQGYLRSMVEEFGLGKHIHFGQNITATDWDQERRLWTVHTADGSQFLTRSVVGAWGQLNEPNIPNFPGTETFEGVAFHSAKWRHDLDLTGKRVASIGSAATAVQYVPEVAKIASNLTVFQRSANYILPRDQYIFSAEESARFQEDPDTYRQLRQEIHEFREAGFERTRRHTAASEEGVELARQHLEAQVSDPELRAKLTPDYDFGCKRILRSDDFYPALTRENVELVTEAITEITPRGLRTADGVEHGFDVIIYATGFKSHAFMGSMRVTGRDGIGLAERWGNSPEAYLGITVDNFPNLFLVYGPNTNLNHNSVVSMLEAQHRYIAQAVKYLAADESRVLEVDREVVEKFNAHVQEELQKSAFSSECSSWYKNEDGRVINNWSGTVEEYRGHTHDLQLDDYLQLAESGPSK